MQTNSAHSARSLPIMIFLSDGKANFDANGKEPYRSALDEAEKAAQLSFPSIVVDTDTGVFSMGLAREIAKRMNAFYVEML